MNVCKRGQDGFLNYSRQKSHSSYASKIYQQIQSVSFIPFKLTDSITTISSAFYAESLLSAMLKHKAMAGSLDLGNQDF